MKIVFCCTGNTCRSPMAEMIAENLLKKSKLTDINVCSRGVQCINGEPLSKGSEFALNHLKMDIKSHFSQLIDKNLILESDIVLTMTNSHKQLIAQNFGTFNNVFTFGEYVGGGEINDPYGESYEKYFECATQIKALVKLLLNKLKKLDKDFVVKC